MRVNALFDDRRVLERILRRLGPWQDRPAVWPRPGTVGAWGHNDLAQQHSIEV